jgi:pyruvyltransferase
VHAVRGPLTKQVLESRGIVCPPIFGDPALLLPRFYTPNILKELGDKIGIIPHYTQITYYRDNLIGRNQFHIIDPTMHWKTVIDNICSCKYIVSSSLHGLICSDAYGKPNIWLNNIKLDEGDFKFRDYFLSQERPYYYTQKVTLEDESKLYSGGNKIDLDKLHDAFPFL